MTALMIPDRVTPPALPQVDVLGALLASLGVHTRRAYEKAIDDFVTFSGPVDAFLACSAGEANAAVLAYRTHLASRGLAPSTIGLRLAAVKTLARFARILGRVSWSIEIPAPRAESYRDTRGPGRRG